MIIEESNRILLQDNHKSMRDPSVYWPSQASIVLPDGSVHGQCLRRAFYDITGYKPTNPASLKSKRTMVYGKIIEEAEIDLFKKAGCLVDSQTSFSVQFKNITIRGKIDAILFILKNIGLEIKTGGGYYFKRDIWGTETRPGAPKVPHLMQVMVYLDGFKAHPTMDLDVVVLLYIDRESTDTQEFVITLDAGFPVINGEINRDFNVHDIYKRFALLDKFILSNELPPTDYTNMYNIDEVETLFEHGFITKNKYKVWCNQGFGIDYECEYCPFLNQCRKDCLHK